MKICQVFLGARSQFIGLVLKYIPIIASSPEGPNPFGNQAEERKKEKKKVTTMSEAK
jgi:hypothetical protein